MKCTAYTHFWSNVFKKQWNYEWQESSTLSTTTQPTLNPFGLLEERGCEFWAKLTAALKTLPSAGLNITLRNNEGLLCQTNFSLIVSVEAWIIWKKHFFDIAPSRRLPLFLRLCVSLCDAPHCPYIHLTPVHLFLLDSYLIYFYSDILSLMSIMLSMSEYEEEHLKKASLRLWLHIEFTLTKHGFSFWGHMFIWILTASLLNSDTHIHIII